MGILNELDNIKRNTKILLDSNTSSVVLNETWADIISELCDKTILAGSIMEKFVNKVETGRARSIETYAEMKEWLEE